MTSLLAGLLRLLFRMGIIFMIVSLLGAAILAASILLPRGLVDNLLDSVQELLPGDGSSYSMFEPDEVVYDYALGAEVPRIYYLSIPKLGLYAPVVAVSGQELIFDGQRVTQLHVPHAFAVGWSQASAPVGAKGNTVFVGHNNIYGEVFKDLWYLQSGDQIVVQTASGERSYRVSKVVTFEEKDRSAEERFTNAAWIAPTPDEQLTLVTCWPYVSNSHRLVVVALPESG